MPVIPEEASPDKLSLALEPEAAAIYCQNITAQQVAAYCESVPPFTSKSFLVVDIGGGTVDISAHRISSTPEQHIEVILPPAGNDCGGSMVNKKFAEFLGELVGDKTFSQYVETGDETVKATNRARLNELINDTFERQKRIFGEKGGEGSKVSIRLPYTFMEHYRSKLLEGIRKLKDSRIELSGIDLRVAYAKIEEFFQPVVEGLLQCITETILSLDEEIETIYIVGGFGGCQYIYNAITEEFGDGYKYITPTEHDFAVVRGAVLFRQNPNTVYARRADATYGVRVNIPFQEGKHEEDYKWVNEKGDVLCENIFSTFVERGDIIPTSEVVMTEYAPTKLHQQRMHIDIYSSPEKDVWYTTGRRPTGTDLADVQKIGELMIPFPKEDTEEGPQGSDKQPIAIIERKVEVTFDFSHTEIQVKGYDKLSNTEVKVVLDFLSL